VLSKQVAMLQQNLTSNQLPVKIIHPSLAVENSSLSKSNNSKAKSCKHRNENGYCRKGQRQCLVIN
jgi:hypothetical protein